MGKSVIAAAACALLLAARLPIPHPPFPGPSQQDDLRAARTKGSAAATVTVYEMSDFQCPFCAQWVRQTLPALEREYVATGKVRLVFVNYPLPMHPNAEPAAELAMCAARQGRFWQMHDALFRTQESWEGLRDPGGYFLALADTAGADRDQLVACLRSGSTREIVRQDAEGSARAGATGTPTFYVEGGIMRGIIPITIFRQVLDSIIRSKRGVGNRE